VTIYFELVAQVNLLPINCRLSEVLTWSGSPIFLMHNEPILPESASGKPALD